MSEFSPRSGDLFDCSFKNYSAIPSLHYSELLRQRLAAENNGGLWV